MRKARARFHYNWLPAGRRKAVRPGSGDPGAAGPGSGDPGRGHRCECERESTATGTWGLVFHEDTQDTRAPGWLRLLELIDGAAEDRRTVFKPFAELSAEQRGQVVTLPPTIAKLTSVRQLLFFGSNLVRIPPEIGAMTGLEEFDAYMSPRLHWYPYEITRCARLAGSKVSTSILYGNFKGRPPFPALRAVTDAKQADFAALDPAVWGTNRALTCSVCGTSIEGELRQVWISRMVGTDVLPLLVNACSAACVAALPDPEPGYVPTPHTGGPDIVQPPKRM